MARNESAKASEELKLALRKHMSSNEPLEVVFVLNRSLVGSKPDRDLVVRYANQLIESAAPEAKESDKNILPYLGAFVLRANADVVKRLLEDKRVEAARSNS